MSETIAKYKPAHPLLKEHVSEIVFWRRSPDHSGLIVSLPNNVSGFGFTLSGGFYVNTGAGFGKMPDFGTRNLLEKPAEIRTEGDFLNISIRCIVPNGLCLFTKVPMNVILGMDSLPLEDIFSPREIRNIGEQLLDFASDNEKMAIIESFLVLKLRNTYPALLGEIVKFIHASNGLHNLSQISKRYSVSERTINRYFNKYIGISPIAYINLIRFRSIVDTPQRIGLNLLSSALDVGYYDQSHFIRHFKGFSTLTPYRYFKTHNNNNVSDFYKV